MDKDMELQLVEVVVAACVCDDGKRKLSCAAAFELASQYDCSPGVIGKICNQNGIKMCKCQLGYF